MKVAKRGSRSRAPSSADTAARCLEFMQGAGRSGACDFDLTGAAENFSAPRARCWLTRRTAEVQSNDDAPVAPVDWTALMSSLDGDADTAAELVQLFISSGDEQLAAISAAVAHSDYATVGAQAHSLKGASANLQAHATAKAAERLEAAAKIGSTETPQLALALEAELARTVVFLKSKVA